MPRSVFLVGMMGVGKTTVGFLLAKELGWQRLDSDEQIEATTGTSVWEIFVEQGESAFRTHEKRVLNEAAAADGPVVVSVAGGAVLDRDNRRMLQEAGVVVWLRAPVETLSYRVGSGEGRPLLGDDPSAALARLYEERRPLYEELADIVVDVEDLTPEEVVEEILRQLP